MLSLVDCSNCGSLLQYPQGAKSIRCAICSAVTLRAGPRRTLLQHRSLPGPPPALVHGRPRAVLCGISYRYSRHELSGCINDAKCMKYMLINRFKFPESSILMLTEEETDPYRIPTKQNIIMALYWLVQGCQPGDSLVFHFSGHSSLQKNYDGDEVDGFDETLCPLDFETQGMIVDDDINATIVRPLPPGVKLHAIIDACYSDTMLDLPFLCRMNRNGRYEWEDHRPRSGKWNRTNGGVAISFGYQIIDKQRQSEIVSTGALTYSFIQAFEHGYGTTYGSILNSMRSTLRSVKTAPRANGVTSLLTSIWTGQSPSDGLRQEPQLTASEPFDVCKKPFSL